MNWISETIQTERKIFFLSSLERREDASHFRCNLFRVVTTFPSPDVSELDSQADFYFKARGDRLCSAVRRRVYYLNSHIPETSRSKTGFHGNGGSEKASLCMQVRCICQLAIFYVQKKTRRSKYVYTRHCHKSNDCQRVLEKKNVFLQK